MGAQLLGDFGPVGAGLDACHAVFEIDPTNAVHAAHVDGDDASGLVFAAAQGVGDVGTAAIGNQAGRRAVWRSRQIVSTSSSDSG